MANHKQALKRHKQSEKRHLRNQSRKSTLKSIVRKVREAIAAGDVEKAKEQLPQAIKVIQKTASAGVIHKAAASRRVSRLMRAVNKMSSEKAE